MAYWIWYRKGSFALKEQYDRHELALSRAADLMASVGTVEIVDPGKNDYRVQALLKGALELNAAAGSLVLRQIRTEAR